MNTLTPLPCSLLVSLYKLTSNVTVSLNLDPGPSLPSIYRSLGAPHLLTTVDISIMHTVRRRHILCIIRFMHYWIWDALYDKAKGQPRQRPTLCIT